MKACSTSCEYYISDKKICWKKSADVNFYFRYNFGFRYNNNNNNNHNNNNNNIINHQSNEQCSCSLARKRRKNSFCIWKRHLSLKSNRNLWPFCWTRFQPKMMARITWSWFRRRLAELRLFGQFQHFSGSFWFQFYSKGELQSPGACASLISWNVLEFYRGFFQTRNS